MPEKKSTPKTVSTRQNFPLNPSPRTTVFSFIKNHGYLFLLSIVSFTVNLVVLGDYFNSPFAQTPVWDADIYWKWAKEIAEGNWMGNAIFHQTPLYPYFLSIIIKIFGITPFPVLFIQALFSTASVILIFKIASCTVNKHVGIIAGLLYVFYGMQLFYSMKLLSECLSIFLLLLTTYLLMSYKNKKELVFAGITFGLLTLAKPNLLLATPFIAGYVFFAERPAYRQAMLKFFVFAIPVTLIICSATFRNYVAGKDFVLISSNGGENFYIGNNPDADGTFTPIKGISRDIEYQNEDVNALAQAQSGKKLKRSDVSNFWFHKGIDYIVHNPVSYIKLLIKKVRNVFSGAERTTMYYFYFEKTALTKSLSIPFINFYLLLPFFLVGTIFSIQNWRKNILLYLFLLVNIANILIFFYDTRFMLPAMPFWIIFAGQGIWLLYSRIIQERSFKIIKQPVMIVFLIATYCTALVYSQDQKVKKPGSHMYLTLGDIYYKQGDLNAALNAYTQSSYLQQNEWMPVFGVSKVYFAMGKKDVAVQLYNEAFPNLTEDFKKLILREKDLNELRAYRDSSLKNSK